MKPASGGGAAAAGGLYFQYLVTLEALLDLLQAWDAEPTAAGDPGPTVHIDSHPPGPDARDRASHVVDFSITDADARVVEIVQVKSTADAGRTSNRLTAPSAIATLLDLVEVGDADRYVLITNAALTGPARLVAEALVDESLRGPGLPDRLLALANSRPELMHRVGSLSETSRRRLSRSRIVADPRTAAEVRSDLRTRLRSFRIALRGGVGHQAAGLLTQHLLAEVFERASSVSGRWLTLREFRALVLTETMTLAAALGKRWSVPWGTAAWIPDVERAASLAELARRLEADRVPDRVRRCAVTGLSGIGKSSVAAAYVYEFADMYDFVVWIDAANAESVRASVTQILDLASPAVDPNAARPSAPIQRDRLHRQLARHPGSWLVIFDGALDQSAIADWIPRVGAGHVIVTSTNSASWSQFARVALDAMTPDEACALLALRLDPIIDPHDPRSREQLMTLARALECWPLALELAAAYILSTGLRLGQVRGYLQTLRTRALADDTVVLASYPRTLVAAIMLCVERIVGQVGPGAEDVHLIALRTLNTIAYLAPRRIPVHLAVSATVIAPVALEQSGLRGSTAMLRSAVPEVVRVLIGQSLVLPDRPSAEPDQPSPGDANHETAVLDWTVSTNEIVQEVIRLRLERETPAGTTPGADLDRIAYHAQRWLAWCLDARDFARISLLEPHAGTVAEHMRRLGVASAASAVLLGNLANDHGLRGSFDEAIELLERELAQVRSSGFPVGRLHLMIHQQLAHLYIEAARPVADAISEIAAAADCLRLANLEPLPTAEIENLLGMTMTLIAKGVEDRRLERVGRELLHLLPADREPSMQEEGVRLHQLIGECRDEDALALASRLVRRPGMPPELRVGAIGARLECLIRLGRMSEAFEALAELQALLVPSGHLANAVLEQAINAALAALEPVTQRDAWAGAVMISVAAVAREAARLWPTAPGDVRARMAAVQGIAATLEGDARAARRALGGYRRSELRNVHSFGFDCMDRWTRSWLADRGASGDDE